jgi:hypothetical protein
MYVVWYCLSSGVGFDYLGGVGFDYLGGVGFDDLGGVGFDDLGAARAASSCCLLCIVAN